MDDQLRDYLFELPKPLSRHIRKEGYGLIHSQGENLLRFLVY